MTEQDLHIDKYELYEELFERRWAGEPAHRRLKPGGSLLPKNKRSEIVARLTDDMAGLETGFAPTYRPSHFEEGWLLSSLASFYDLGLMSDVLSLIKGGKEANVYLCLGEYRLDAPSPLLAAKVYRPRMFRNLRNDKIYREGREIMGPEGKVAGKQAGTIARAIRNKTAFGMEASHVSWLSHEYAALQTLYGAGAAVPRPVAANDNTILMGYCGGEGRAAPTLNTVSLHRDEAEHLLAELLRNVDLMLQHNLIHGDLSAYNILYWEGQITLIDFPQIVNLRTNQHARWILRRDLIRTCEYFTQQGVRCDPAAIADRLWRQYVGETSAEDLRADLSRLTGDQ